MHEEEKSKTKDEPESEPPVTGLNLPNAKIETVQENLETHSLTPDQLREYCEKRFLFKTIKVRYLSKIMSFMIIDTTLQCKWNYHSRKETITIRTQYF